MRLEGGRGKVELGHWLVVACAFSRWTGDGKGGHRSRFEQDGI